MLYVYYILLYYNHPCLYWFKMFLRRNPETMAPQQWPPAIVAVSVSFGHWAVGRSGGGWHLRAGPLGRMSWGLGEWSQGSSLWFSLPQWIHGNYRGNVQLWHVITGAEHELSHFNTIPGVNCQAFHIWWYDWYDGYFTIFILNGDIIEIGMQPTKWFGRSVLKLWNHPEQMGTSGQKQHQQYRCQGQDMSRHTWFRLKPFT